MQSLRNALRRLPLPLGIERLLAAEEMLGSGNNVWMLWRGSQMGIGLATEFNGHQPLFDLDGVFRHYGRRTAKRFDNDPQAMRCYHSFLHAYNKVLTRHIDRSVYKCHAEHLKLLIDDWLAAIGANLEKDFPKQDAKLRAWIESTAAYGDPPEVHWEDLEKVPAEAIAEMRQAILAEQPPEIPSAGLNFQTVEAASAFAQELMEKAPLSKDARAKLIPLLPSIRLHRGGEAEMPVGTSRIGGLPDLPSDWKWPGRDLLDEEAARHFKDPEDPHHLYQSIPFLAQINLAELPAIGSDLPNQGILYFFVDLMETPGGSSNDDLQGARVLYFDGAVSALAPMKPPPDLSDLHLAAPQSVAFTVEMTPAALGWEDRASLSEEDWDEMDRLSEGLIGPEEHGASRILGHEQLLQEPMQVECELLRRGIIGQVDEMDVPQEVKRSAEDWILLLQLDQHEVTPDMNDSGRMYYWIRRQDLADRRFDQAIGIMQSH